MSYKDAQSIIDALNRVKTVAELRDVADDFRSSSLPFHYKAKILKLLKERETTLLEATYSQTSYPELTSGPGLGSGPDVRRDVELSSQKIADLLTKEAESKEAGPSFVEDPVPKVPDSRTKESDKSVTFVHEEVELSDVPRDLVCLNSRNSTVVVLGNVETLRLADCSDCTFVAPCVRRSVVLERCDRMKLYIVCQQLRVHKSNNCLIRGYVAVAPLFEMVTHIQLGSWKTGPSLNLGRSVEVKGLAESTEGLTIDPYKPSAINSDDPGDMLEFEILDDPDPQSATVTILSD